VGSLYFFVNNNIIPIEIKDIRIEVPPFDIKVNGIPLNGTTPTTAAIL